MRVGRWERWESSELARSGGGEVLVLFKSGGHRVSPRFHFLVSDVDQQW